MARGLFSRLQEDCTIYVGKTDADQMHGYHAADLHLSFAYSKSGFSHDTAHIMLKAYKISKKANNMLKNTWQ